MKIKRKSIVALAMTGVMAMSLTACGGSSSSAEAEKSSAVKSEAAAASTAAEASEAEASETANSGEGLKITFVSPLLGHEVWLKAKYGAEDAAAEIGATVTWVGPSGIDMDEQVRLLETAVAENVDGIISCPLSPVIFEDIYAKAQEKGIPVVNVNVDTEEDTRVSFIGTDYTTFGEAAAQNLAEALGNKGNIAVLVTSLDSDNQMSELKAGEAWLEKNAPDVKIIVTEATNSDTAQAADKTSALIDAYPELNAIWCLEGASPLGSSQAVAERGKTDDILILGIDDTSEVLDLVEQGAIWGTQTQNFYKMGYDAVMTIADTVEGKEITSIVDSGTTLVTKENVEEYRNR